MNSVYIDDSQYDKAFLFFFFHLCKNILKIHDAIIVSGIWMVYK